MTRILAVILATASACFAAGYVLTWLAFRWLGDREYAPVVPEWYTQPWGHRTG